MSATLYIDQPRLDQPYFLDKADTTYICNTDVHAAGTAFVVAAPNVVLDLNGHTVTYGDSTPAVVPNAGFEEGSDHWDLSNAPAAALAANPGDLWGEHVLHMDNFSTTQTVVSAPIALPQANHTYAAAITPAHGDWQTTVTLSVIDAVTGQVLQVTDPTTGKVGPAVGKSGNVERGLSAVVRFLPTTTDHPVRLKIDVTPPAGKADSLDLDYATLAAADDYGILASHQWGPQLPGYYNLSPADRTKYDSHRFASANFTLRNSAGAPGSLIQGQGDGYASDPLFCKYLPGLTVDHVQTQANGMDTVTLDACYASVGVTVTNSTFRENIDNISNRLLGFATLQLGHIDGPVLVDSNNLLGCPQIGISLSYGTYNTTPYRVEVTNNYISQNAVVTNGYGIGVAALQNFEIAYNRIEPTNGRGISVDGWSSAPIANGEIHDNYVSVQEGPNREYDAAHQEARALRLRNDVDGQGPQHDLHIYHNTFRVVTGPGLAQRAYGVRISYVNNQMNNANILLDDNVIQAIVTTDDPAYRAQALLVDGVDAGINPIIADNTLESNDTSLALGGSDKGNVSGVLLLCNTLVKSDEGADRPYTGILAGYWYFPVDNVRIIDTRVDNGATSAIVWSGSGAKGVDVGWLLSVTVTDCAGDPLPGATVSVLDKNGTQVTGTAGAGGLCNDIPVVVTIFSQTGADPTNLGPFQVLGIDGTLTGSIPVADFTANRAITLMIGNPPPIISSVTADGQNPDTVTGNTTQLAVTASDPSGYSLSYSWSLVSGPAGVTFSNNNGTTTGNNVTATFTQAGSYTFQVIVTDSQGASSTATVPVTFVVANPTPSAADFSNGFSSTVGLTGNGFGNTPMLSGSSLRLTDGGGYEARSVFTSAPVNVQAFSTSFSFTVGGGPRAADGFTFTIQGAGPTAVGGYGGALGYAGVGRSVAVKFDLYSNAGEGSDCTGLHLNGAAPYQVGSLDLSGSGIDLHSGHTFDAALSYDGASLTLTLTDEADPGKTFTHTWAVDIPAVVGGPDAYVGFTAGTGAYTSTQDITRWTYTALPA